MAACYLRPAQYVGLRRWWAKAITRISPVSVESVRRVCAAEMMAFISPPVQQYIVKTPARRYQELSVSRA